MKVYCHLCGATLRGGDQFQRLDTLIHHDAIYICRDQQRCERRSALDPLTGKQHHGPIAKAPAKSLRES